MRSVSAYERLLRIGLAVAIVGGPLGFLVGGALAPGVHVSGESTIAENADANTVTNAAHLVAFFVASFLLPIGAVGLGYLSYRSTPWLATIAGILGVVGWLPFSALTALDDLGREMATMPDRGSYAALLDRFSTSAVMSTYLIIYVVFHLVAYVLFGVALRRARVVPAWAAWSLIASSLVTIAAFAIPGNVGTVGRVVGDLGLFLLLVGSLPAARAMMVWQGVSQPDVQLPAKA